MSLILTTLVGLVIWVVLWAIGVKAIDALLIPLVLLFGAMSARLIASGLPGTRNG